MKSLAELKAEEARVRAILDAGAEAQLRAIPGVVHVSVGLKQINGTATDEFCIRVYVTQKKAAAALAPGERIPAQIQGVLTDINQVKVIAPHEDTARYRPITGGIQITNGVLNAGGLISLGTLGCLATDNSDGKQVLVTNFHVIGGTAGVSVFQPSTAAGDLIGTVKRGSIGATFDAAIADIAAGIATTGDEINGLFIKLSNKIAGVTLPVSGMRVFKVGRTTGLTDGKVVDADAVVTISYDPPVGPKSISKAILIQCTKVSGCCCCTCNVVDSSREFSDHGDSGAAVVSDQRMAVGLIVGGGGGESYACRMAEVQTAMNVSINRTIVVAPQSLDAATDAAPALPGGAVVAPFAAAGAAQTAGDDTVWSQMQRRMNASPVGRELGALVGRHVPEVVDLVNHHRAVMVAWQRVQGPSFLAQWMNGVRHPSVVVPRDINGVTLNSALLRLAAVLKQFGSPALQQAVDSHGLELMDLLDRSRTVDELIASLDAAVAA